MILFGKNTNQEKKWKEKIFPNFLTDNKKQANNPKQSGGQFLRCIFALEYIYTNKKPDNSISETKTIFRFKYQTMEFKTINSESAEKTNIKHSNHCKIWDKSIQLLSVILKWKQFKRLQCSPLPTNVPAQRFFYHVGKRVSRGSMFDSESKDDPCH